MGAELVTDLWVLLELHPGSHFHPGEPGSPGRPSSCSSYRSFRPGLNDGGSAQPSSSQHPPPSLNKMANEMLRN